MDQDTLNLSCLFGIRGRNARGYLGNWLRWPAGWSSMKSKLYSSLATKPTTLFKKRFQLCKSLQFIAATGARFLGGYSSWCEFIWRQKAYQCIYIGISTPDGIKHLSSCVHSQTDHSDILLSNAGIRRDPDILVQPYSTAPLSRIQKSTLSHTHAAWGRNIFRQFNGPFLRHCRTRRSARIISVARRWQGLRYYHKFMCKHAFMHRCRFDGLCR